MTTRLMLAGVRDVPLMGDIMAAAFDPRFGEAWSAAQLGGALSVADTWAQIALVDGGAVGFSLTRRIIDEAELMLVAVEPARRGLGCGRLLVEGAMEAARERGAFSMFLEVRDGNHAALRLYDSLGFAASGRRNNYYTGAAGERFDAITMRRDLR
jgi:ribosomal-protein-alanine N-acetyltransferase